MQDILVSTESFHLKNVGNKSKLYKNNPSELSKLER